MPEPGALLHANQAQRGVPDHPKQSSLVVVLSYPYGGSARLEELLFSFSELACTAGTGLLPLCDLAATTWQQVEDRDGPLSSLAVASIRAMIGTLITGALGGTGKRRLCEIAFAHPRSAEVLLRVYPGTRFICLHRNCLDVINAGIKANPWGLARSAFQAFTASYLGNNVAAIAAYWAASTEPLLDFEAAHPDRCHRIRYEHLVSDSGKVQAEVASFLQLGEPVAQPVMGSSSAANEHRSSGPSVPVDWIPEHLARVLDRLMIRVGYQPISIVDSAITAPK